MEDEKEIKRITRDEIKVLHSLELKGDFYSLTFFGLYLDTDDEELSSHECQIEMKKQ
jgi:hypothetical protein